MRIGVCHKVLWRVVLHFLTLVEDQNLVALNNSVQTVSNRQNCRTIKFFCDELLNSLLCDHIDVGGSLIQKYDLVPAEDCSANAD